MTINHHHHHHHHHHYYHHHRHHHYHHHHHHHDYHNNNNNNNNNDNNNNNNKNSNKRRDGAFLNVSRCQGKTYKSIVIHGIFKRNHGAVISRFSNHLKFEVSHAAKILTFIVG